MNKITIIQSNYIPWKGYFDLIAMSDVFVVYDEVQYTKNDWRNRNYIKTSSGLQWLTIPVKHVSLGQKINETEVIRGNWQKKHIRSIQASYSKAQCFKSYSEEIFNLYEVNSKSISDINIFFIKSICKLLQIKTKIIDSRELNIQSIDKNLKLIEICKKMNASNYISGPSAKNYLDVSLFNKEGINVEWMDYSGYPEYPQLFPPFQHGVSILDLLFNLGSDARRYLKYT